MGLNVTKAKYVLPPNLMGTSCLTIGVMEAAVPAFGTVAIDRFVSDECSVTANSALPKIKLPMTEWRRTITKDRYERQTRSTGAGGNGYFVNDYALFR